MAINKARTIRNFICCKRCDSGLIVECEPVPSGKRMILDSGEPRFSVADFACPVCKEWNRGVKVSGGRMVSVFLDPRATGDTSPHNVR